MSGSRPRLGGLLPLAAVLLAGCEDGSFQPFAFVADPISVNPEGNNGCNGADLSFASPAQPLALSAITLGPMSRIAAAGDEEKLFVTGLDPGTGDAIVAQLDFTGGGLVESVFVTGPQIQDVLTTDGGISDRAELSGVAVVAPGMLVLMEHTSNAILGFEASTGVFRLAGEMSTTGGYTNPTVALLSRFDFEEPGDLCPTGDGRIFIADTGNNRVRFFAPGPPEDIVATLAGTGDPASEDGDFETTTFDTPWGLSVNCMGRLLVTESGAEALGGNRLRQLTLGLGTSFIKLALESTTVAGDGQPMTAEGVELASSLARPSPAVTTSEGDVYWVDTLTGVLRRQDQASGLVDCPGFADCATATSSPLFSATGGNMSLALSFEGHLFVLDSDAQALWRFPAD